MYPSMIAKNEQCPSVNPVNSLHYEHPEAENSLGTHHTRCQFSCLFKRFIWGHTGLYDNIFKVNKLTFSLRPSRDVCGQKCNSHKDPGEKAELPFTCAEAEESGTAGVTTHTCLRKRSPNEGRTGLLGLTQG